MTWYISVTIADLPDSATLAPPTMNAQVFNANPTVYVSRKPARKSRFEAGQSLWVDDDDEDRTSTADVEPIDQDEIFGNFAQLDRGKYILILSRTNKVHLGPRTSEQLGGAAGGIRRTDRGRRKPRCGRVHTNSASLWHVDAYWYSYVFYPTVNTSLLLRSHRAVYPGETAAQSSTEVQD